MRHATTRAKACWKAAVGTDSLVNPAERGRDVKAVTRIAVEMAGNLGIIDPQVNRHPNTPSQKD